MKSKLLSTFSMLRVLMVAALTVFCVSCDKTETTDSTGFILYYMGGTDIGPGLSYDLQAPAYKGSAPYDFTITNITLDEETFSNDENFVINTETGAIAIQNTGAMASGLYSISVGCYSNGKFFEFKDAVQVNMLLAAPEGVTIEPDKIIVVNQDEEKWAETSAQVTTEKDKHISILGYAIAQDESKPYLQYFDVTSTGKIIIKEGITEDQLIAGEEYTLSLKLTTKVGDHMFADAVTFKVVSKPRKLVYSLNQTDYDLFEARLAGESSIPQLKGGKEDLKFAIKSINPEISGFSINEENGQISLPENHEVPANKDLIYSFTITVSNSYGSTDFENVYAAKVTDYVKPIDPDKFSYTTQELYQLGGELTAERDPGFEGDAVEFSFAEENTDEEIIAHKKNEIIKVDGSNGTITIANNHTLSVGPHEIKVKVINMKNKEGVIKSLSVNVLENPNDFTYVDWGTNIEHEIQMNIYDTYQPQKTKESKYRNQFRFINRNWGITNAKVTEIKVLDHNIPEGSTASYKLIGKFPDNDNFSHLQIGSTLENGTISTNNADQNALGKSSARAGAILLIEVTSSNNGIAPAVKKNIPVFFNATANIDGGTLLFTPFVVRINPKTNKCSSTEAKVYEWKNHTFKQEIQTPNIAIDYRTNFSYWNFDNNTNHKSGNLTANVSTDAEMLFQVWNNCGYPKSSDMGTRVPLCYYDTANKDNPGPGDLTKKAAYIDPTTHQIVINAEKWKGKDGLYPNGVVIGEIRYTDDGNANKIHNDGSLKTKGFPLFLWFDETYEGN